MPGDICRHCGQAVDWQACALRPALAFADGGSAHLDCHERAEVERSRAPLLTAADRRTVESEGVVPADEAEALFTGLLP